MDKFYVPMNLGGHKSQSTPSDQQQQQGYTPQQPNHNQPQQQYQNQYQHAAQGAYHQQYQHYQQYQQYYQQPQQQSQSTPNTVNAAATPSVLPPTYSTPLPPSYNTPLPPSKSKQQQNGNRRPPNNKFNNNHNQHNRGNNQNQNNNNNAGYNPLSQYQAQYQSSTQMGAAAASAAAAALSAFVYNAPGSTAGPSATTASSSAQINNNSGPKPFQQPTPTPNSTNVSSAPQADWFSNYQTPTIQQRMAVTMASNATNLTGGAMGSGQPHHYGNPHGQPARNNFQRGGHQQQHQRGGRNQRGKRQQQQGGAPNHQNPNQNQQNKQTPQNKGSGAAGPSTTNGDAEMESSGFHCDACDVTFHEEAKLKTHIAAHRSCPDCQYKASPSLVSEHRKVTHGAAASSGPATLSSMMSSSSSASGRSTSAGVGASVEQGKPQKSKAAAMDHDLIHPLAPTLNTPEDIASWIAQRRKAWPTESNIQKKEQERQEMIAKGQIVEDLSSKDKNGRDRRGNNNNNNNKRGQGKDANTGDRRGKRPKIESASSAADVPGSIEPSEEDDDDVMDPVKDAVTSKDPRAGSRNNRTHDETVAQTVRAKTFCRYFTRGTCNRGDKCPYIHDTAQAAKTQKNNQASNKKDEFRSRPSLLKMLLSGEIKEEKNKLLEAIRYIVENNFFDKQEPSGTLVEEVGMES
ncbi:hypothetical protein BG015_006886 [Linnemannia schmuckeri]|uniref:C3H1-type domain-containing protein n=1 Tax=Linnemannia schmuckeri TaxID=64567 RepID=A0A9P5VBJ0_9FUNG|nr:hypothetical protein BG015_006886 [Linnemannia schmuckeri]